jgi:hypothetical protein
MKSGQVNRNFTRASAYLSMRMKTLSVTVLLAVLVFRPGLLHATPSGWKQYRDATTGLSFWYPPSLQVRDDRYRIPTDRVAPDVKLIVTDGRITVMGFTVWHDAPSAFQPISRACKPIRLAGEEAAFECVLCMPACMWTIEIVSPRLCTIRFEAKPDGSTLEIAKTVHFESSPNESSNAR